MVPTLNIIITKYSQRLLGKYIRYVRILYDNYCKNFDCSFQMCVLLKLRYKQEWVVCFRPCPEKTKRESGGATIICYFV